MYTDLGGQPFADKTVNAIQVSELPKHTIAYHNRPDQVKAAVKE